MSRMCPKKQLVCSESQSRVTARADIGTEHRRSDLRHAPSTCTRNLTDHLELLHGGGSDVHVAAKGKGTMQEGGWQRHCTEDLSKALITTLCILTWSTGGRTNRNTNSRSRTRPIARDECTRVSIHASDLLAPWAESRFVAQPPGRRVRQSWPQNRHGRGRGAAGRSLPQVPDRADRLEQQRRLSAHSAGESIISYT